MIIGVDAAGLAVKNDKEKTGNYWLAFNFLKELSRLDKKNIYRLYSFTPISTDILQRFSRNFVNLILGPKRFWMQGRMSWEMLTNTPDVFIGFNQSLPYIARAKNILFILDLAFEKFPENYPKNSRKLSWQTKSAIAKADKIIAISNSTKNDLMDMYGVSGKMIEVIYPFCEKIFMPLPKSEMTAFLNKYKITKPFFLYVGANKKSKNIEVLKKAYAKLPQVNRQMIDLLITFENFGYLTREELPLLYNAAFCLVSPSHYEGFGLPHLEAISCGIPVICSDNSAQREVAGRAGLYIKNPDDITELSEQMQLLLINPKKYTELKKNSLSQSNKFNSDKSVRRLLSVMENL